MFELLKQDAFDVLGSINIDWFQGKNILITGASGLLGIQLISAFKQSKLDFKCVVMINSNPELFFTDLIEDSRFMCDQCDLTNGLNKILCYDAIFHLATYGQPAKIFSKDQMENQIKTIELNTAVVIDLFKYLKPDGKFVFLSTSEVYSGLTGKHKETEIGTTNPEHPRACYIEAKRCGEAICNIYKNQGYDVKIIRLCLGYGIGVKSTDRRVLNTFIHKALTEGAIRLLDSGNATRAYCYVSDVIEMILNIMLDGRYLVYNVGSDEITSIKQLAFYIGAILNVPITIPEMDNKLEGATNAVTLDINRYIDEFGIPDFVSMKEGLERTITWWECLLE